MGDLDDFEAFLENIEQTAPQEAADTKELSCKECGTKLEEVDEVWVCPNCGAQATDILQLEETELHYDESGRAIMGAGARIEAKKSKSESIDYGWAWSTDDAISHILTLQVTALENTGLVAKSFRQAVSNMWFKFWLEQIAPFIKDEYDSNEWIPIEAKKALRLRDIEVLVRVQDKVMIPWRLLSNDEKSKKTRPYKHMGQNFTRADLDTPPPTSSSPSGSSESSNLAEQKPSIMTIEGCDPPEPNEETSVPMEGIDDDASDVSSHGCNINDLEIPSSNTASANTRTLNKDSVTILTLNRTLAFLEATARCLEHDDPLFASDIIRACNCRLIPFYGAYKTLPEGMKLNYRDKMMFQKIRPPTPTQVTATAALLIHKVYRDQMPKSMPTPDLDTILRRIVRDLNLPDQFYELIKGQFSFQDFPPTRPTRMTYKRNKRPPQYDRWAFAILVWHLKKLYHLGDKYINKQGRKAAKRSRREGVSYFVFKDWLKQMSNRMKIILTYDPFVLLHPLAVMKELETTPQMLKYIETLQNDKPPTNVRLTEYVRPDFDVEFRDELTEFLCNQIPRPNEFKKLDEYLLSDLKLDQSSDVKHPISDSLKRTKKYWYAELRSTNEEASELVMRDFSDDKLMVLANLPVWSYDDDFVKRVTSRRYWRPKIDSTWPNALRLLLLVGSFVCMCEPSDLILEVACVEAFIYPRKRKRLRNSSESIASIEDELDGDKIDCDQESVVADQESQDQEFELED